MDAEQQEPTKPVDVAFAASVVLALVSIVGLEVAITALTDWRWALLLAGLVGLAFAYVLSTKARS